MIDIPTILTGPSIRTVSSGVLTLATDGGGEPVDPNEPLDLYYQPDTISLYKQPSGDLYKRPGSP
jgi:hypothetical protein